MILPILAFSTVFFLLIGEILFPKNQDKKTPEQELKEAIAKYISETLPISKE